MGSQIRHFSSFLKTMSSTSSDGKETEELIAQTKEAEETTSSDDQKTPEEIIKQTMSSDHQKEPQELIKQTMSSDNQKEAEEVTKQPTSSDQPKEPEEIVKLTTSSDHKATASDREPEKQVAEDEDGFKTPTSPAHRIPAIRQCPPAPRKPSPPKRKFSPPSRACRSLQFEVPDALVESIFRSNSNDQDEVPDRKVKRGRVEEDKEP